MKRRDFLKLVGIGVAAPSVAASLIIPDDYNSMSDEELFKTSVTQAEKDALCKTLLSSPVQVENVVHIPLGFVPDSMRRSYSYPYIELPKGPLENPEYGRE